MQREELISESAWINTIFDDCVELLIWSGDLIGMTYYEINVWFFCVLWPLFTFALCLVSLILYLKLRKLKTQCVLMEAKNES